MKRIISIIAFTSVGLTLLGTGVMMAATSHHDALLAVGGSNISMVLALSGALVLLPVMAIYHYKQSGYNTTQHYNLGLALALGVAIAAVSYAGIHIGIGSAMNEQAANDPFAVQAKIAFAIGLCVTAATYACIAYKNRHSHTYSSWKIALVSSGIGLICAAATTLGPALVTCMGAAASNSAESITMEVTVALVVSLLALSALQTEVRNNASIKYVV